MSRRMLLVPVLIVLLIALAGCAMVVGSGNLVTREESYRDFDRLEIGSACQIDIRQGDSFGVVIRVDDNVVPYLDVYQVGRTLHIGLQPGTMVSSADLRAEITMPALAELQLSGASQGTISGFSSSGALTLGLSGASHLRGDIAAGDVRADASGASSLDLELVAEDVGLHLSGASQAALVGVGRDLTAELSGASGANLAEFGVGNVRVSASGASSITVNMAGRLDVEASGASRVYFLGSPAMGDIELSGGSAIERE